MLKSMQAPAQAKVIDASGKYVMPGGIDPHVHLEAPMFGMISVDTFYRHAPGCMRMIRLYEGTGDWSACKMAIPERCQG